MKIQKFTLEQEVDDYCSSGTNVSQYSLKRIDVEDPQLVVYEGETWGKLGKHADRKVPIRLVINPIGRIAEGTAQTMDGEVKVKLRITPLSKVFHVQLGLMSKLEGEIREIKETYDYAVENNQVGRFSLPAFVPDPIKYDDEYFGYSMKWQGPGDKKFRIIYDGEIRVNRGENAGKKYPVRIIINRKTDRAVIRRMDEKKDYKFPYKREVQMSGLRGLRDVANIVSTLVFKLKRHTEEIWTAYVIDSKGE